MSEEQIGKYNIVKELGKGSMGVVYLGEDPEIGRHVAIKTLRSVYLGEDAAGQEALQRFRQESRSAGRLRHPNIVTIFEAGRTQTGSPFIVMEYVDGESLEDAITKNKKFEPLEALHLLAQVGSAIDYAHTFNIIHRDIKPSNVILDSSRKPYLLDFGVAKLNDTSLTPAGTVVGTPSYMAPEQIRGEGLTTATDRFAFAVLTYEMMTGLRPFPGNDFMSVASNIIHSEPLQFDASGIDLDKKFEPVLNKGLSKNQADRYPSCLEFIKELGKQFDIPVNQSGVIGYQIGMTLRELIDILHQKPGASRVEAKSTTTDDVAATVIGRPALTDSKPASGTTPPKSVTPKNEGIQEGGGKGIAVVFGGLFLVLVAAGAYYLLGSKSDSEVPPEIAKQIDDANEQASAAMASANSIVNQVVPGCGLGGECNTVSDTINSVTKTALSEAGTVQEAIPLNSSVSEVSADDPKGLVAILSNSSTSSDKLIETIPQVGQMSYDTSSPVLLQLVSHPDYKVRIAVLKVFTSSEKYRTRDVFKAIVERLDDGEFLVRGFSAKFLASLKNDAAKRILANRLTVEKDPTVRKVIENALAG